MTHAAARRVVALGMLLCVGLAGAPLYAQSKSYDPPLTVGKKRVYAKEFTLVLDAVRKTLAAGSREVVSEETANATTRVLNARYRPSSVWGPPMSSGHFRAVVESVGEGRVAVRVHWPGLPNEADLIFRDIETRLR